MIKKIFVNTLLAIFFLLLVLGAVNRTVAKTQENEPLALSENQNSSLEHSSSNEIEFEQNQEPIENWETLSGVVDSVSSNRWTITLADGSLIEIKGQVFRFLSESGFSINVGDHINLIGFYETDLFEIGQIENMTQNTNATIRDEFGRALWSGRSRENKDN
jgi:hypothetical protein